MNVAGLVAHARRRRLLAVSLAALLVVAVAGVAQAADVYQGGPDSLVPEQQHRLVRHRRRGRAGPGQELDDQGLRRLHGIAVRASQRRPR
jgi:hypothetical protein